MIGIARTVPILVALAISAGGCKEPIPEFVREMIGSSEDRNIRAVWGYRFNGENVYYVQHGCCDMYNDLYNADGENICSPDGGITGVGDGKCPTFWDNAKRRIVIWERGQEDP